MNKDAKWGHSAQQEYMISIEISPLTEKQLKAARREFLFLLGMSTLKFAGATLFGYSILKLLFLFR
jgi:hypothetical protein